MTRSRAPMALIARGLDCGPNTLGRQGIGLIMRFDPGGIGGLSDAWIALRSCHEIVDFPRTVPAARASEGRQGRGCTRCPESSQGYSSWGHCGQERLRNAGPLPV